jgi:hypothetical protein
LRFIHIYINTLYYIFMRDITAADYQTIGAHAVDEFSDATGSLVQAFQQGLALNIPQATQHLKDFNKNIYWYLIDLISIIKNDEEELEASLNRVEEEQVKIAWREKRGFGAKAPTS